VKLFGDGAAPLVLNYEDPEDVVRKLALAQEELTRLAELPEQPPVANPGAAATPAGFQGGAQIDPAGQPPFNGAAVAPGTIPPAGNGFDPAYQNQPINQNAPSFANPPVYQA